MYWPPQTSHQSWHGCKSPARGQDRGLASPLGRLQSPRASPDPTPIGRSPGGSPHSRMLHGGADLPASNGRPPTPGTLSTLGLSPKAIPSLKSSSPAPSLRSLRKKGHAHSPRTHSPRTHSSTPQIPPSSIKSGDHTPFAAGGWGGASPQDPTTPGGSPPCSALDIPSLDVLQGLDSIGRARSLARKSPTGRLQPAHLPPVQDHKTMTKTPLGRASAPGIRSPRSVSGLTRSRPGTSQGPRPKLPTTGSPAEVSLFSEQFTAESGAHGSPDPLQQHQREHSPMQRPPMTPAMQSSPSQAPMSSQHAASIAASVGASGSVSSSPAASRHGTSNPSLSSAAAHAVSALLSGGEQPVVLKEALEEGLSGLAEGRQALAEAKSRSLGLQSAIAASPILSASTSMHASPHSSPPPPGTQPTPHTPPTSMSMLQASSPLQGDTDHLTHSLRSSQMYGSNPQLAQCSPSTTVVLQRSPGASPPHSRSQSPNLQKTPGRPHGQSSRDRSEKSDAQVHSTSTTSPQTKMRSALASPLSQSPTLQQTPPAGPTPTHRPPAHDNSQAAASTRSSIPSQSAQAADARQPHQSLPGHSEIEEDWELSPRPASDPTAATTSASFTEGQGSAGESGSGAAGVRRFRRLTSLRSQSPGPPAASTLGSTSGESGASGSTSGRPPGAKHASGVASAQHPSQRSHCAPDEAYSDDLWASDFVMVDAGSSEEATHQPELSSRSAPDPAQRLWLQGGICTSLSANAAGMKGTSPWDQMDALDGKAPWWQLEDNPAGLASTGDTPEAKPQPALRQGHGNQHEVLPPKSLRHQNRGQQAGGSRPSPQGVADLKADPMPSLELWENEVGPPSGSSPRKQITTVAMPSPSTAVDWESHDTRAPAKPAQGRRLVPHAAASSKHDGSLFSGGNELSRQEHPKPSAAPSSHLVSEAQPSGPEKASEPAWWDMSGSNANVENDPAGLGGQAGNVGMDPRMTLHGPLQNEISTSHSAESERWGDFMEPEQPDEEEWPVSTLPIRLQLAHATLAESHLHR